MTEQTEQMVEMANEITLLRSVVSMYKDASNMLMDSNDSLKQSVKDLEKRLNYTVSNDIISRYKKSLSDAYDQVRVLEEQVFSLKKQNAELNDTINGKVFFSAVALHKLFTLDGSADIYEKLDEQLFKESGRRDVNAYNVTKHQYAYVSDNNKVNLVNHKY
jgi:hypothetical protein